MNARKLTQDNGRKANQDFDLCRVTRSKEIVDVCSNTIRAMAAAGKIRLFKSGKTAWFSKSEFAHAIMGGAR